MNRQSIIILRWILTIPSAIAGFYVALFLGVVSQKLAVLFCPDIDIVSAECSAAYMQGYEHVAIVFFPTLAAVLVVLFPYIVAPRHKSIIALACYSLGAAVATYLGFTSEAKLLPVLLSAVIFSGLVTLMLVRRSSKYGT